MVKTVASGTGLTPRQKQFLAVVLQAPYILKRFYLTGGTALASWYLHHRESDDLDFFSEEEANVSYISNWLKKSKDKIGFEKFTLKQQLGFNTIDLAFPDSDSLKVEFSYYPSERVEKSVNWHGLAVDSLYDIALNKFQTIAMSPRAKDYIDLYFIVKKTSWDFRELQRNAGAKHGIYTETLLLARQFLKVVEFKDYPRMLVPFDPKKINKFFLSQAKSLEKEIFK